MADEALLALVRKIAGEAKPGEQVEAYAARSQGTEVKVFGGEVESVASENIAGVGVRVVVDGRQGFAWAGSLEPDVVAETLAEARDNAGFGGEVPGPRARSSRPQTKSRPGQTSGGMSDRG